MSEHKPLLDILVEHATPEAEPPAGLTWGFRAVHPDLRSRDGYRYPWPGGWAVAPDDGRPLVRDGEPCPSSERGGLCVAKTAEGAAQGGIRLSTVLLVAYHPDDVLGEDEMKVRVARMWVADVLDVGGLARAGHLYGADLYGSNLRGAHLGGSNLRGADLGGSDLRGSDLRGANLFGSNLFGAHLYRSDLRGSHLGGSNLRGAHLGGSDLRGSDLRGANLFGSNLFGAHLRGSDLCGADLGGAHLGGAHLDGSRANSGTRWPDGFDAKAAGVVT